MRTETEAEELEEPPEAGRAREDSPQEVSVKVSSTDTLVSDFGPPEA